MDIYHKQEIPGLYIGEKLFAWRDYKIACLEKGGDSCYLGKRRGDLLCDLKVLSL